MTREVYEISGSDAEHFLQGLVTNDVARMANGAVYAALLTPQGKYIADFFLVRQEGAVMLDVKADLADDLVTRLNMYTLRADVTIGHSPLKVFRGTGAPPAAAWADPRHPALGWRLYGNEEGDDGSDFEAIRVAHCIPESGVELTLDTFILEAGFERLNGVDFRKGCYVGQEVTARMHHKTTLRKGLEAVAIDAEVPIGTEITAHGKSAGRVYSQAGGKAIVFLRFDRARDVMRAGAARVSRLQP